MRAKLLLEALERGASARRSAAAPPASQLRQQLQTLEGEAADMQT